MRAALVTAQLIGAALLAVFVLAYCLRLIGPACRPPHWEQDDRIPPRPALAQVRAAASTVTFERMP